MLTYQIEIDDAGVAEREAAAGDTFKGMPPPRDYIPDRGLVAAINVAIRLGRPLLLTGKPGTGKSSVAMSVAWQLKLGRPLEFIVKSDTQASDLFYTFDAIGRFAAEVGAKDPLRYINYQALGKAALYSQQIDDPRFADVLSAEHIDFARSASGDNWSDPRQSVVLVDEIDKAQRDVPNDILVEIDRRFFLIKELNYRRVDSHRSRQPIVIITSNSERALPDAFLRRCVYYDVPFPKPPQLREILSKRLGSRFADADHPVLKEAVNFFDFVRSRRLAKEPATAELLDWLTALYSDEVKDDAIDFTSSQAADIIKVCLTKTQIDQASIDSLLEAWKNQ